MLWYHLNPPCFPFIFENTTLSLSSCFFQHLWTHDTDGLDIQNLTISYYRVFHSHLTNLFIPVRLLRGKKIKNMSSLEHHFFDVLERHTPWYWRYRIQRVHRSSLRAIFAVVTRHGFWPFGFDLFLPPGSLWPYSGYRISLFLFFHYNTSLSHFPFFTYFRGHISALIYKNPLI